MLDFNLHLWIHRQTVFTDSGFQKCFWTRMIFTTELFLFLNISQKLFSVQRTVMTNGSAQGGKMQMLPTIVLWQFSSFMHIFPPILHGQVNVTLPAHNVWCSCNLQIKLQRKYAVIFFLVLTYFWLYLYLSCNQNLYVLYFSVPLLNKDCNPQINGSCIWEEHCESCMHHTGWLSW